MAGSLRALGWMFAGALAGATLGCSGGDPAATGETYTLDLSAFPQGLGDANSSIAFPLDLANRTKKITEQGPSDILEIYDRVGCWGGAEHNLESSAVGAGISQGDVAKVTSLDLALVATNEPGSANGVCYGYRAPGAGWHYDLTVVEPSVAPTGAFQLRVPVTQGPMDAVEIVFESVYPPSVAGIQFTVD